MRVRNVSGATASGPEPAGQLVSRLVMAAALTGIGVAHLVARPTFEAMIPKWIPGDPALWNYAATAAELGSAALLARRKTARLGGLAAFATFAVVWVANLQHAVQGGVVPGASGPIGSPLVAWIRAPLQLPLLYWAWRIAHPSRGRRRSRHQFG
jgi:uncharacterized membrane protein